MEPKQIDLYEFLVESELQQYYNSIKNELKITNSSHLKYATDEDLKQLGLSRPEIRRLRKFYEKYYPHGYLSKIKRLLQPPRKDDGLHSAEQQFSEPIKTPKSPNKIPSNKHIIPADAICVNKQLGTGEFGIVQQGVWTNGIERIQVAIKCLCRERMQSNPMEFLKEAAIMHANEHENIVRLYGVVLDTDSLMLVTELAHLRSLLECLKDSGLRVSFLTVPTLCEFAMQICNGMMYLESKRLIHRDLAARNILVFSKNKVKISDFGLSRALGVGKDYYKTNFNVNLKLPIAWCAPECINYLRFTNSSDVWAYGVCLWEMFSYGFQPWAALTGLQILEAIDEPNYQRLEQPECCPRDYYNLMLKCWQHDPYKRPKFSEIFFILPDLKPEQLKTVVNNCESKKDNLLYRQGEIITVLDKNTNSSFWKGVLNSGKTGLFNPVNTVAYLEGLPCSTNRDSFSRNYERSSKRKIRSEMISMPQNDLKHTGHVGLDGAYFGDVAFLGSSQNYNRLPRQIVTPYKPSEDIEQTPLLLPPTPTSPDSLQTASGYFPEELPTSSINPTFINSNENTPIHQSNFGSSFKFPPKPSHQAFNSSNPFAIENSDNLVLHNNNYAIQSNNFSNANITDNPLTTAHKNNSNISTTASGNATECQHEYHEISDDEITADTVFDLGPSLLDEINSMFGSINNSNSETIGGNILKSPNFDYTNKKNVLTEQSSSHNRKNSSSDSNGNKCKKKTSGIVKQISVKDEKILNHAIEIANEISARSMTDLVSDHTQISQSPKRKFSFRFPHLSHHAFSEKDGSSIGYYNGNSENVSHSKERKNFSEELKSIPDLQRFRSLNEIEKYRNDIRIPIFDKKSSDFCFQKSKEILSRPINIDLPSTKKYSSIIGVENKIDKTKRDLIGENLLDIEKTLEALNLDFIQTYNELDKSDSAETLLLIDQTYKNKSDGIETAHHKLNNASESSVNQEEQLYNITFLEKQLNFSTTQLYNDVKDKLDEKRSSTPDTGFASRETNLSLSRRSSQKSNYSPQDGYFTTTKETNYPSTLESRFYINYHNNPASINSNRNQDANLSSPVKNINTSNSSIYSSHAQNSPNNCDYSFSRQRSMSFTNNPEPIKCRDTVKRENRPNPSVNFVPRSPNSFRNKSRTINSTNKPRSVKARTLRRLSYNPIIVDSSSSTGSESDFDRSTAHSECDIRTKVALISKKHRQYLNRKTVSSGADEITENKMYGSNASIKSAPHYNYKNERLPQWDDHLVQSLDYDATSYDDKIYEFDSGGGGGDINVDGAAVCREPNVVNNKYSRVNNLIKPPRALDMNSSSTSFMRESLYSAFDVSKLTGKSPTSNNFLNSPITMDNNKIKSNNATKAQQNLIGVLPTPVVFQWPEKIHASIVQQNDKIWRQQQAISSQSALFSNIKVKETFFSETSSNSDEMELKNDFIPRIPPSPAP